ncbi:MAG TPA: hypothetical protein VGV41_18230 [Pseudolabrys sp.]|nr:hypothetical protein [Pseudolabrys sp.]HEV2630569.1 hypothetical protein [Pseudolabrys sp.]
MLAHLSARVTPASGLAVGDVRLVCEWREAAPALDADGNDTAPAP